MSAIDYFSDFNDDLPPARASKAADDLPTFPCQSCAGTGKFRGVRVHQTESKCFACSGKGWFRTSHGDRMKARAKVAAKKASLVELGQAAIIEAHPGLVEFLKANTWSEFLRDMLKAFETKGELSDNMVAAIRRTQVKVEARDAERKATKAIEQAANTVALDLSSIHTMFNKAQEAGLKKLVYRAEGVVLSLAKPGSANPGAIYVKTVGGEYLGKVLDKKFQATREATPEHKQALDIIAANPSEAASNYGKKTGKCSCCGRELTDPVSVKMGIGPICAEKWGF